MSGLRHFLAKNGIKVKGEHFPVGHVAVAAVDTALTAIEIAEVHGAIGAVAGVAGPIVATAGVWMALGSGYAEAREIVENENTASGFSQGFVAALLGWSPKQTADHFMRVPPAVIGTPVWSLCGERRDGKLILSNGSRRSEAVPLDQPVGIVRLLELQQRLA
jgi:hypothetical protein